LILISVALEPFADFDGFRLAVRAGVRQENAYLLVRLLGHLGQYNLILAAPSETAASPLPSILM
jgi:hypothetical protein